MGEEKYVDEAQTIVQVAQNIKDVIAEHGFGTTSTLVILGELMKMTQVGSTFLELAEDERDEFFAAIFDASVGNEPNALVSKVGVFQGETLEIMSDAMKSGALAYLNRELPAS